MQVLTIMILGSIVAGSIVEGSTVAEEGKAIVE